MIAPIEEFLAEDHALVRAGFRGLLGDIPGVTVVGEAADGRSAVTEIVKLKPDVALMDISMPSLNGLEAIAQLALEVPSVRVIVLSIHDSEDYVWQALRSGAAGYLLKESGVDELEFAIRAVARGGSYLSPSISRRVLEDYVRNASGDVERTPRLTPRQREIAQLIAEGNTNNEIAAALGVSVKTVKTHRASLMDRLEVHDVAGVVRYAIRAGMVTPET